MQESPVSTITAEQLADLVLVTGITESKGKGVTYQSLITFNIIYIMRILVVREI